MTQAGSEVAGARRNRATQWRRWVTPAVASVLLGGGGLAAVLLGVAAVHGGRTGGDPYTYLQYSRNLAAGHAFLSTPVTDAVAARGRQPDRPRAGATWNTHILPDGRTAFTVAPGYPLVLAAAWKAGGAWLATHLNLGLLACMLVLLAAATASGARGTDAAALGLTAALLLPRVDPGSFAQFSYAWREPLYVSCLLGAAWAVSAYAAGRNRRTLWVAAFLAGWACSVKEANAVYLPVFGAAVLASSAFRRADRKAALVAQCAALFALGVSPLLIQNTVTTGVPWVSLQSIRETRNYSLVTTGAGLSAANAATTLRWYARLYLGQGFFVWPALVLALVGAARAQRRMIGRVMLGLFVMHVALYVQWRNADPRLMYFALVPYVVFLAEGVYATLRLAAWAATRLPMPLPRAAPWLAVLPVLALACWPRPWLRTPARERATAFSCRDALRLAADVEAAVPRDSVVLANRAVRDVVGTLTVVDVARWQDLVNFLGLDDALALLGEQRAQRRVFFLDNVDRDPSHSHLVDWRNIDVKQLSASYDLVPAASYASPAYHLSALLDAPELRLLELRPQTAAVHRAELALPAGGAAALWIDAPVAASSLAVSLDGSPVDSSSSHGGFLSLASSPPSPSSSSSPSSSPSSSSSSSSLFECRRADGGPVPALLSARLISWEEPLAVTFGSDACPDDGGWIVERDPRERTWGFRLAADGYRLRLPVRQRADMFTCAGLMINGVTAPDAVRVVQGADGVVLAEGMTANTIWFPLPASVAPTGVFVGSLEIRLDGLPADGARLHRAVLSQARRRIPVRLPAGARGFVVRGEAFANPAPGAAEPPVLSLSWAGASTDMTADPTDGRQVCLGVNASGPAEADARVVGGGLVDPRCSVVTNALVVAPSSPETCDPLWGFYSPERDEHGSFAWSRGASSVWVPLSSGRSRYRLRIQASSGLDRSVPLTVSLNAAGGPMAQTVQLETGPGEHAVEIDVADAHDGLARLCFGVQPWSPARELGSASDFRELGFRLYRLEWRAAD